MRPDTVERIKQETVAALRQAAGRSTQIDTDKVKRMLSEAEQRILEQVAVVHQKMDEHDQKMDEHDQKVNEHDGFISRIRRNFMGIVKG